MDTDITAAAWLRECTVTYSPGMDAACAAIDRKERHTKPVITPGSLSIWASIIAPRLWRGTSPSRTLDCAVLFTFAYGPKGPFGDVEPGSQRA
jgi:hypothetical protein